jgi:ABC-type nitrate/sulfonate/bicarbonate transport system substrate-binding protein
MKHIRLSFYCPGCEPGYHMPYLRAASDGTFARHGLDVDLLEPAPGPENVLRVADGGADFCLTSVAYFLEAQGRRPELGARFVAAITQRSPMSAIVREASTVAGVSDLSAARVGGPIDDGLLTEYLGALTRLGIAAPPVTEMGYLEAREALGRGDIDVVGDFIDLIPLVRRVAGPVRPVHLGVEVYASGLVAADRLEAALVERMRDAIIAALSRHREIPEEGVAALVARYPETDPDDALESWMLIEPLIFAGIEPGTMTHDRWARSIEYSATVHRHPRPAPETVYRTDFAEAGEAVALA